MSDILGSRLCYKPFQYQWAFDAFLAQQQVHWLPEEVSMADDIRDYKTRLTVPEREVITQTLKFFTQADLDVSNNYMIRLLPKFKIPDVNMKLGTFSAFENLHVHAYACVSDSLNLDTGDFYESFLQIKAMKDKHDYLASIEITDEASLAKCLAIFGGFVEGVQLFASFAILNSFPRRDLMKGMGTIISWSIRDETLHCKSITKLFRTIVEERPELFTAEMKNDITKACGIAVMLEDAFVDTCFSLGPIQGITTDEIKQFVRFMADKRLIDLGLEPLYNVTVNPLPWLVEAINGLEHVNFFEQRSTSYSKGSIIDDLAR